ncbi:MAG: hypothetical protein WCW66_00850 [Patescibacteria group bacterium]|jgi:hypothetical protein
MESPKIGMDDPKPKPEQVKKEFQFGLLVSPKQLWNVLYERDINAPWTVAKQQILNNITKFLQDRGRHVDGVEMERIDKILEGADEEFKNPAGNTEKYPSGTLAWGMDKLQQAIAEELNRRE